MPPSRKPHGSRILPLLCLVVVLSFVAVFVSYLAPDAIPRAAELPGETAYPGKTIVEIGSTWVAADVAVTDAARERGLSGRSPLGEREAMLFIHQRSGEYPYWMKDMLFPIDIIWINAERQVVGVTPTVSPDSYPETFAPQVPVLYVLEVPAGFALRHNIHPGTTVAF